ncbi:MAG: response regulator [Gammaproteobacteria bacterium]|nr:response regulator [Gammaproteobacteria bacterium]
MSSETSQCVLVLDDDIGIRESLMLFLEDSELDAVAADNADVALRALQRQPCDIAIVDLRLPGKTGEEFILEIHRRWPDIRFIIHTGSSDYRISPQLMELGIRDQDIFIKPVSDLQRLIHAVTELRQLP